MSKFVSLHGFGGSGGSELNFDVVAYDSEEVLMADTPAENTIGVVTNTPITSWIFSADEPLSPTPGIVWISTSSASAIAFNALKKNDIQVYPISAKQYVDGTWANVTAKSYQGGEWASWITYLYKSGNEYTSITGGFSSVALLQYNGGGVMQIDTVTKKQSSIYLKTKVDYQASIITANKIDVSKCSFLRLITTNASMAGASTQTGSNKLLLLSSKSISSTVASRPVIANDVTEIPLETLSGEYYVAVALANGSYAEVTEIYMS